MESPCKYEVYFECANIDRERKGRIEKYFQVHRKSKGGECGRLEALEGNVYKIAFRREQDQRGVLHKREHVSSDFGGIIVHETMQSLLQERLSTAAAPKTDHPKVGLSSPPEHEVHLEGGPHQLKEPLLARKHLEEQLPSTGLLAQIQQDKDRVVVIGQGTERGDKVEKVKERYRPSQAADKVDIVGHMQEQPAETELAMAKLDESQTGSLDKLKNMMDIPSSTVQPNKSLPHLPSSCRYEETQRGPLSDQPVPRDYMSSAARQVQGGKTKSHYSLPGGVQVLVCHGDITKETADALVNAANRYLNHAGGVAGALSRAGGPAVQQESTALVRQHGPYTTGNVVMTSGGNLQCKKLFHIVGPVQGEAQGQEKALLKSSVWSALTLADNNQFRSIAMPCISSGIFQVPIAVCAEAIVTAVGCFGRQSQYLRNITLIDTREEVVRALQAACDRILSLADEELETAGYQQFQKSTGASGPWSNSAASPVNTGEKVGAMVSPMKDHDPGSAGSGRAFSSTKTQSHQPPPGDNFPSFGRKIETQNGSRSDKPLTQYVDQDARGSAARQVQGGKTKSHYSLPGGVLVLVCHGDITKETADALVNAANRDLDHAGGVAGALSRAGGSAVQRESTALVREHGPYTTGEVVMTSGGNLQCKKLFHIVGPVQGEAQGREKALLKSSVWSALKLADDNQFRSIAMPCISSGIFKVPIAVCAEAIVTAVGCFGRQSQYLRNITLIDTREEVVRALQAACDRILSLADEELETAGDQQFQESIGASGPWSNSAANLDTGTVGSGIQLKTMFGVIETQQVDAIVSPMKCHDRCSTPLGRKLSEIIGPSVDTAFHKMERDCPMVEVDVGGIPALCCRKVLFVNLLPWDGQHADEAVIKVLKQGIHHVLSFCQKQAFGSVAFPMLETSNVLQFPWDAAESVLSEEIGMLQRHRPNEPPLVVHIVAQPRTTQTNQAMPPQQTFKPHRITAPRASFCRYDKISSEEVSAMVGKVQLQLVRQDIVHEKTDVIVNTISVNSKQSGVSNAILKAAGSLIMKEFHTKLAACPDKTDVEYQTSPGNLQCKTIIHATFYDEQKIRSNCENILKICESSRYSSVSFPALGTAVLDPMKACNAMLDGFEEAVKSMVPTSLSVVRIVLIQTAVYKEFRKVLQNRCEGNASQQEGARAHQEFQWHGPPTNTHSTSATYSSSHGTRQHQSAHSSWELIQTHGGHSSNYENTWCNFL